MLMPMLMPMLCDGHCDWDIFSNCWAFFVTANVSRSDYYKRSQYHKTLNVY